MKKKYTLQIILWTTCVALVLLAILSLSNGSLRNVGKSYAETEEFQNEIAVYYDNLKRAVLNPINVEAEKKKITVTKSEIEEHRYYYGSLAEQIANIEEQYTSEIADAKAGKSDILKKTLIEERDRKIEDIRKNFESDAHIAAKIRSTKEQQLENAIQGHIQDAQNNLQLPAAYELKDIETGEVFSSGDIQVTTGYQDEFNGENGYLIAEPNYLDGEYYEYPFDDEVYVESTSLFGDTVATPTRPASDAAVEETVEKKELAKEPEEKRSPSVAKKFEGTVVVPQDALNSSWIGQSAKNYERNQLTSYIVWGLGALALGALLTMLRFRREWVLTSRFTERYDALKLDLKLVLLLFSTGIILVLAEEISSRYLGYHMWYGLESVVILGIELGFFVLFLWIIVFQMVLLVERLKGVGTFEQDLKDSYSMQFVIALQGMFLNWKMGTQMFILLIGFFLAGFGFLAVLIYPPLIIIYVPLALFVGFPFIYIFVRRTAYLNRIMADTEAMAEGRLHKEIVIEGKSPLADHARNLNNLREGVHKSMSEQAKSERLKTELITNVSHDLRTPLTSIITYTDLLKNDELTSEERTKYVDILDKKSQRLKTLIEDLFDVSKMASGNMAIHKQRVDLAQLLQQALAEHEEEISKTGLDFRVSMPETALVAYVDGKRWWRVLDNLIVNAIKYTLPGTRVYITLRKVEERAEFVVKNVTKYELGENTDELFERFKRADTSRHTDGSGLGLAIAQSIVDLHNGNMSIEVDGDLFKVTVSVAV